MTEPPVRANDRVRLIREYGGVPAGTVGTVKSEKAGSAWVQFEWHGARDVPEQYLEPLP
jgi:hypothetical protein